MYSSFSSKFRKKVEDHCIFPEMLVFYFSQQKPDRPEDLPSFDC